MRVRSLLMKFGLDNATQFKAPSSMQTVLTVLSGLRRVAFASASSASSAREMFILGPQQGWLDRPLTHYCGQHRRYVPTLIILVPVRPSRENAISMPSVRRNVCARRRRPASARGFLAHAPPVEMSLRALSAHKRSRSDALPVHMV